MEVLGIAAAYWGYFTSAIYIINIYLVLLIIYQSRDTRSTFAWIFLILFVPLVGALAFLLFGRRTLSKSRRRQKEEKELADNIREWMEDHHGDQVRERAIFRKRGFNKKYRNVFHLASRGAQALLYSSNNVRVFNNGKEKFDALYEDIKNAKEFIHIAYFIWRDDKLTRKFVDLLEKKADEGVEVRLLFDWIGSVMLTPFFYITRLRRKGIKCHYFSAKYSHLAPSTLNYRNHMKIAVIDGKVAYTGGMNMGKEYVDGGRRFERWRDCHLRISGDAVASYNAIFLAFWDRRSYEKVRGQKYFPGHKRIKGSMIQTVDSGIDVHSSSMENLILNFIVNARKTIYIQTPYFIPSESISTALKVAALSGVKVNVMVAGKPDKYIPYWAAYNYFPELLRAGVKIYHYNRGFMHSKVIIVDKEVSIVGSTNIDLRSFKLNYELATILYDFKISRDLVKQFAKDLRSCKKFTLKEFDNINFLARFRNSFSKLFAPIL